MGFYDMVGGGYSSVIDGNYYRMIGGSTLHSLRGIPL